MDPSKVRLRTSTRSGQCILSLRVRQLLRRQLVTEGGAAYTGIEISTALSEEAHREKAIVSPCRGDCARHSSGRDHCLHGHDFPKHRWFAMYDRRFDIQ